MVSTRSRGKKTDHFRILIYEMEKAGGVGEGVKWRGPPSLPTSQSSLKGYIQCNIGKHSVIFIKCGYSLLTDNGQPILGTKEKQKY